jgi:hypothetical protein
MEVIETKEDAIKYIQGGKNAGDILTRLEQLSTLLGSEEEENEEVDD